MEGLESLFERALRLDPPWKIKRIEFHESEGIIKVDDNKLWRMMYYDAEAARQKKDYSGVTQIGVDETSRAKGMTIPGTIPGTAAPQCGNSGIGTAPGIGSIDLRSIRTSGQFGDRFIRNERHFVAARDYIVMNPVKAGLVTKPEDWPWSSAKDWVEKDEKR